MTISIPHQRRFTPLAGLMLALLGIGLLPAPAKAAAFIGSFDPAYWTLVNTSNGAVDQTLTSSGNPPITAANYYCGNGNDVACVENISAASGAVDVVGSITGENGGGNSGDLRTTTWTVSNGAQPSRLSFNWSLTTAPPGSTTQTGFFLKGLNKIILSSSDGSSGSLSNIYLAAGEVFGFGVSTSDNIGEYGILSITGFNADETLPVPGPLPLAGALTALGWSRRLRSRIRSVQQNKTKNTPVPRITGTQRQ